MLPAEIIGSVPNNRDRRNQQLVLGSGNTNAFPKICDCRLRNMRWPTIALARPIAAQNELPAPHALKRTTAIRRAGSIWISPGPSHQKVKPRYRGGLLNPRFIVQEKTDGLCLRDPGVVGSCRRRKRLHHRSRHRLHRIK